MRDPKKGTPLPAEDLHAGWGMAIFYPYPNGFEVVPRDGEDLDVVSRGIMVGKTGRVRVTLLHGATLALTLVAGHEYRLRVSRVWKTGTSAEEIVALW